MRRIALALLLLATAVVSGPEKGPFKKIAVIRLREDAQKAIDPSVKVSVLRRLDEIKAWGADCVILDVESYGGYVHSSVETGDEIFALGRDIHTIAYVGRKAISGAAMLSLACREVVMSEAATIGDSQVIYQGSDGEMKIAPEKFQTTVAATFRKYAQGNGYPVPVLEAMVRQEMEVTRFKRPVDPADPSKGETWAYYRSDRPEDMPSLQQREELDLRDQEVVVREGELPTFSAKEAKEYGIASRLAPTLEALIAELKDPAGAEVRTFEWNWAEKLSRTLLGWRFLLFVLGAGGLYFALKIPGTGIPELVAVVGFGLYFGASYIAGFSGSLEVILFIAGMILIAVEIFVLPGFGVAGIAGLACVLTSIALSALPSETGPIGPTPFLVPVARDFLLAAAAALVAVLALARFLPSVPLFGRLALEPPTTRPATPQTTGTGGSPLIGSLGITESQLRPAGRALFDGVRRDVVSEGEYIDPGTTVRIVETHGNVIVVRPEATTS